jgi:hypothetical protein
MDDEPEPWTKAQIYTLICLVALFGPIAVYYALRILGIV